MSRPGLDPGTLRFEPDTTLPSADVRASWSEAWVDPPASADILSNLLPGLHDWLHNLGDRVTIAVHICTSDDLTIELTVEKPS